MDSDAIELDDHPELGLIAERVSSGKPCRLTKHGKTVARVTPERQWVDTRGRGPDWKPSEEDIAAFRRSAGSWAGVDIEEFIANIYRWRDESPFKPSVEL
jgi:antitoxin (DNA-binding transcriptional repressor) of toxin-antitoxin stability system